MLPGEVLYKHKEDEFTEKGKPQGQRLAVFTHDFQEREREASRAKLQHKRGVSCVRQGGSNQDLRQQRFLTTNIATDAGLFPDKRGTGAGYTLLRGRISGKAHTNTGAGKPGLE